MGDTRGERYDANICSCCFANLTAECLSAGLLFCFFGGTWVPMPNQDRSLYCEDWGEALTNRSEPAICVVDLEIGTAEVLEGVPPDVSPGQVRMQKFTALNLKCSNTLFCK